MGNDLNLCVFIGNLGKAVESRFTDSGTQVANFSIAVNNKYKDTESTTWVNLVAWSKLAEICENYLNSGDKVQVTCKYQTRKYEDKDGNNRYNHEFVVRDLQMLGGPSKGSGQNNTSPSEETDEIPF